MPRLPAGARQPGVRHSSPERLQKVLSELGVASRREVERWIVAGRLSINGRTAVLGARVSMQDQIRLDGRLIHRSARSKEKSAPRVEGGRVLLCHRSPGEALLPRPSAQAAQAALTAQTRSLPSTASVSERLPRRLGRRFISISPMPLIDGGLELLTADGALATRLQRSVRALESEYSVRIRGELTEEQLQALIGTAGAPEAPFEVRTLEASGGEASNRWYRLVALGASGHDIRQLLAEAGIAVARVLRTRLGGLALPRTLPRGHWRELERTEISALLDSPGSVP